MLAVKDGEPSPEHQKTTCVWNEMHWLEEIEHASGQSQQRERANAAWASRLCLREEILERQAEKKAQSEKQTQALV